MERIRVVPSGSAEARFYSAQGIAPLQESNGEATFLVPEEWLVPQHPEETSRFAPEPPSWAAEPAPPEPDPIVRSDDPFAVLIDGARGPRPQLRTEDNEEVLSRLGSRVSLWLAIVGAFLGLSGMVVLQIARPSPCVGPSCVTPYTEAANWLTSIGAVMLMGAGLLWILVWRFDMDRGA